ncbi:MAG: trehalose-phosphatase [Actinomycetota bacterium]|nr:trehalose-phosphatase [Actinomycetota bacterium]
MTEQGNDAPTIGELPSALERRQEIADRLAGREAVVFIDYDGTLTPIVENPEDATLPEKTRDLLERLREPCRVVIISGRDLEDVRQMVGIDGLAYAGSHGFDILASDGSRHAYGEEYLPALDEAEEQLGPRLADIPGARLERKRFAIACHFRQCDDDDVVDVEEAVEDVAAEQTRLRMTGGKRIIELRPDLDWDKGRALMWFLETLGLDRDDVVPLYVGDDVTDEDAFEAIRERGIAVVVQGEDDERATSAHYSLAHTDEVRRFLEQLLAITGPS